MAEALIGLSVAANVIQFIDVGSRFISSVWSIYTHRSGVHQELPDLQQTTEDLRDISQRLQNSSKDSEDASSEGPGLRQLAVGCQGLADELLQVLRNVNLPEKGRKREALKATFNVVWKEAEIKALQSRLQSSRQEIVVHLLTLIRHQVQQSVEQQAEVLKKIGAINEGTKRLEEGLDQRRPTSGVFGTAIIQALGSKFGSENESSVTNRTFNPSISDDRRQHLEGVSLNRLYYSGMHDRQERIAEAHAETFHWIFEQDHTKQATWSNFRNWLESDTRLYWITGKAGSGKSTLMKYICQEDLAEAVEGSHSSGGLECMSKSGARCVNYLRRWAYGGRLIVASFFFWNSGLQSQMSQRGLLLTLLCQILSDDPSLILVCSPKRWEALCLFNEDPRELTDQKLQKMLLTIAKNMGTTTKLCLFVDGLDEFEGQHNELIQLFKDIIGNDGVKICISSRSWVVFEDAFKHKPSMMLQDFTYGDIKQYVTTHFHENEGFLHLQKREPRYAKQLIDNVVSKSCGVFLWIHLVVTSLLTGMGHGDRVSDLQKRLDLLPPDLETLYRKIIQSLDPFYLEHAAQLFTLVKQSINPPSLLLISFADDEDGQSALKRTVNPIMQDEASIREETMRRRLNSRCKGLLEVGNAPTGSSKGVEQTVQYLHRTVKDYIESIEAQQTLGTALQPFFDANYVLCVANLAHLKAIDLKHDTRVYRTFWSRIDRCLYHASRAKPQNYNLVNCLLDDIDAIGEVLARPVLKSLEPDTLFTLQTQRNLLSWSDHGRWAASHPCNVQQPLFGATFLSLAVRYGIVCYVQNRVPPGCLVSNHRRESWPLLLDAVNIDLSPAIGSGDAVPRVEMVACLLSNGANPNHTCWSIEQTGGSSVWLETLKHIIKSHDGAELQHPWKEIAELMIQYGAKLDKESLRAAYSQTKWLNERCPAFSDMYNAFLDIKRRSPRPKSIWSRMSWKRTRD